MYVHVPRIYNAATFIYFDCILVFMKMSQSWVSEYDMNIW